MVYARGRRIEEYTFPSGIEPVNKSLDQEVAQSEGVEQDSAQKKEFLNSSIRELERSLQDLLKNRRPLASKLEDYMADTLSILKGYESFAEKGNDPKGEMFVRLQDRMKRIQERLSSEEAKGNPTSSLADKSAEIAQRQWSESEYGQRIEREVQYLESAFKEIQQNRKENGDRPITELEDKLIDVLSVYYGARQEFQKHPQGFEGGEALKEMLAKRLNKIKSQLEDSNTQQEKAA